MRPDWLTPEAVDLLVEGIVLTIVMTIITSVLAMVVGIVVGLLRLSGHRPVRTAATLFVEIFRNVPALIQIIFWAFAFPNAFPTELRRVIFFDNAVVDTIGAITGLALPYYAVAAAIGLILNTGAHLAELYRSGVSTLPVEEVEAARLLGAGRREVFWRVLLPGGLRASFPAISTRLIHNMKNTALVSFVAVPDLFNAIQGSISRTFRATEYLLIAAGLYLALATIMTVILDRIDRALHRGRPLSDGGHGSA